MPTLWTLGGELGLISPRRQHLHCRLHVSFSQITRGRPPCPRRRRLHCRLHVFLRITGGRPLSLSPTSLLPTSCVLIEDYQGENPLDPSLLVADVITADFICYSCRLPGRDPLFLSSMSSLLTSCVLADYQGENPWAPALLFADVFASDFMCSCGLPGETPWDPPLLIADIFTADFMCSCRLPEGGPPDPPLLYAAPDLHVRRV